MTPDERKVKSLIIGTNSKKIMQEERDLNTNKLVGLISHEVDDNDQLIGVKLIFKFLIIEVFYNTFNLHRF